ncbi:DUF952 domain-containing protein [Brevibacillus sp. TJ4]|uniref:DUF952 domain-containing protein n=1 Tax=Brevibacillus sp. TJ4 TaxID=3234853 RepID=UPI003B9FAD2B
METIYCLVPKSYWEQWVGKDHYLPRDYEQEGFIHATKGEDLLTKVADRVYAHYTEALYVLLVEEGKISSPVKYEQAKDGLLYPHVYGPLQQSAIYDVREMKRVEGHWVMGESVRS